jgi:hypothetical protein
MQVLIDNEIVKDGDFYEDFDILPPRKIRVGVPKALQGRVPVPVMDITCLFLPVNIV